MDVNSVSNNTSVYGLFNNMYQGSVAANNLKLNRSLFPANKAQKSGLTGDNPLQYVSNIKSFSKNLSGSLKALSGTAFTKKGAVSSDSSVMTAKYTGINQSSIGKTTVKVDQTAAGQMNQGTIMNANAAYGSAGTNKFSITVGGKTTELNVKVAAGDTNSAVLQKMADAINSAGLGIKATVETDTKNNTSTLKLEATGTGNSDKNKFTVSDMTGNLVAQTGVGAVTQELSMLADKIRLAE